MPQDASHERASRLTGIALMCGAVACFAMLDTTAKYLNLYMSTLQVVWARYTAAFLFPFIVSNPWTRPGLTRTNRLALQIARSVLLLASTLCNFLALRYLQLAEAIALVFSTAVLRCGALGPGAGGVGALAALDRDRGGLPRRAGGDPSGGGKLPTVGAAVAHCRALLRALFHHHPRSRPHRLQRDHAVLFEHRRGAGLASGGALRVDDAERPPGHHAHGGNRRDGQLRPLSPDRGPPLGAGRGVVAVHLYRDRVGERHRLSGVRRRAQSLHAHGRRHRGRLRPLYPPPRTDGEGKQGSEISRQ